MGFKQKQEELYRMFLLWSTRFIQDNPLYEIALFTFTSGDKI